MIGTNVTVPPLRGRERVVRSDHLGHGPPGGPSGGTRRPAPRADDSRLPLGAWWAAVSPRGGAEGQDIMAWVTQGAITDRTTEHLGRSDIGVAMLREMFREQMDRVARGEDPLGTVREKHERIDLPCEKDEFHAGGAQVELDFCDMGSTRFSPVLDTIEKIHVAAAEKIASERAAG